MKLGNPTLLGMQCSHLLPGLPPAVVDDALDLRLELPLEQPHAPRVVARLLGVVDARQRRLPLPPSARLREEVSGHYGPSRPPIRSAAYYYCTCLGPPPSFLTSLSGSSVSQRFDHIFTSV